jgi:Gas vesicle synthesis protein GvpL/GvpF
MAWYAYCITEQGTFQQARVRRPFPIEQLNGMNGAPVLGYPSGEFVVVVSEFLAGTNLTQESIVDHARVVSDCFKLATVLPFRFGTIFETDEALRQAVRSNKKNFAESVLKLKGKSEMHLKLVVKVDGAVAEAIVQGTAPLPQVGGEYLNRLREKATRDRERQSKARALSVQVHKLFNPLQEEVVCKKVHAGLVIDIAHLIDSGSVEKYQNRYSTAMRHFKDCQISLTGPWPPYHFVSERKRAGSN